MNFKKLTIKKIVNITVKNVKSTKALKKTAKKAVKATRKATVKASKAVINTSPEDIYKATCKGMNKLDQWTR